MRTTLYLILLILPTILSAQKKSDESRRKLESLQAQEKSLQKQAVQIQDSIKIVQASVQAQQKVYERDQTHEILDSINVAIGKGIKLNAGKRLLPIIQENGMLSTLDKNQDFLLTGIDSFPVYFIQHKKKRYRMNIQYLDLRQTKIYGMNERLAKRYSTPTYNPMKETYVAPPASINGYTPTQSSSSYSSSSSSYKSTSGSSSRTTSCGSVQCSGSTKKGARCRNTTTNCNGRCYLH